QPAGQRGNHRTHRSRLMRRVRTSTWVLLAVFLGTLVLYLWVRPPTPSTAGDSPAPPQQASPATRSAPPTHRPRPPRTPQRTPAPHRTPTPTATPSAHRTATPHPPPTPHPTTAPPA